MIIRKLDTNDDWSYGHSESDYLQEQEAVGLNIITKLREWKNDCFFNEEAGIDYPTRLSAFSQKDLLDQEIQTLIKNTDDVLSINTFNSTWDKNKRLYSFVADIITIFSDEALEIIYTTEGITQ